MSIRKERMMSDKFSKEIARMRRIEGQARGIAKMMEDERYCIDILQQMSAVEAALRAAKSKVLAHHAGHCVEEALQSGDASAQREKFAELIDLFGKVNR
jgi:DNA-binding FrmR family transcriptional regulator